jgi:transposase
MLYFRGMTTSTITLEQLQQENAQLRNEVGYLKEQLEWLRRQIFGKRSEKIIQKDEPHPVFAGLENVEQAKPEEKKVIAAHTRSKPSQKGKDTISLPDNLPVETQVIDISDKEKICRETGRELVKIGEEVTSKLAHKPGSYYIKKIIRPKYALPQESIGGIITAALPDSLLTRCQADESFLADILTKKFADHLPLFRISEILAREEVLISRQILAKWVVRCGLALKPLYDEMKRQIVLSGNVFIDETPINMLDPGKGKTHQAYMWVMVGGKKVDPPYRIYDFRMDRSHNNAKELLAGFSGVLHSDKYGAYETLANSKQLTWCPCWAHIRRKFIEAESGDLAFRQWVLRRIKYLFMLERVAWSRSEEERLYIRAEKETPIIDELIVKIKDTLMNGKILPKSKFREALGYFCSLIPHLKNYTTTAWARIDNNVAERAVRPLALGRKNWLFVGSEEGGEAAAIILSLVQSCRAIKINPREYLEDVMRRLMSHNSQKLEELLPDQWAKVHQ